MFKEELVCVSDEKRTNRLPYNLQLFASDVDGQGDVDSDDNDTDEDDDNNNSDEDDDNGGEGFDKKEKTFTQKQVNKMMAKEKRQGRRAALKDYGLDGYSKEDIEDAKKYLEGKKSDAQKAIEEKAQEEKQANELKERTIKAEVKAEALGLNCKDKYLDDVIVLAMAKVKEDGEDADVEEILAEIKKKHKVFFKAEGDDDLDEGNDGKGKKKSKSGGTGGAPREGTKGGSEKGLGARLAARRKNDKKLESKFFR